MKVAKNMYLRNEKVIRKVIERYIVLLCTEKVSRYRTIK